MIRFSFFSSFLKIFIIASLLSSYMFFIDVNNAKAEDATEGQWMVSYCKGVDIEYPFGDDWNLDISSPACWGNLGAAYAAFKGFSAAATAACPGSWVTATAALTLPIIGDITDTSNKSTICAAALFALPTSSAVAGACCGAVALQTTGLASVFGVIAAIWGIAQDVKNKTNICGLKWLNWDDSNKSWHGGYQDTLRSTFKNTTPDINNQNAREYIFGGAEYAYLGQKEGECSNPWSEYPSFRQYVLGYQDNDQKYYMKGPGREANYACDRFLVTLTSNNKTAMRDACDIDLISEDGPQDSDPHVIDCYNAITSDGVKAYDCCVERSQNSVCIEDRRSAMIDDYKFCQFNNGLCGLNTISYEVFKENSIPNSLCVKTYSLCPYNHNLGKGVTEGQGTRCDYLSHCVKIPKIPYIRAPSKMSGEYVSNSCYDLQGDSQNKEEYDTLQNLRHFSAPVAQCFYETLYNIFMHKVGNVTSCYIQDPDNPNHSIIREDCDVDEGDNIEGDSFFTKIQDNIRGVIKMALVFAIMMVGYAILIGNLTISKKDLMMFLVKFALVMYFALGNAWHTVFFNGIYGLSNSMSEFMINLNKDHAKILKINSVNAEQIEIDVEDYKAAYKLHSPSELFDSDDLLESIDAYFSNSDYFLLNETYNRDAYIIKDDGRNLFKINNLDEYPSVNNKWFIATAYDYDTEERGSSDSNPGNVIITAKPWTPGKSVEDYPQFSISNSDSVFNKKTKSDLASISIYQKMDGCQFPKYDYALPNTDPNYHLNPRYEPGKEYLAIWDTLDCKISAVIGQTPGFTIPALFMVMIPMLLSGTLGVFIFFSSLLFVIYLISLTIMALHIFIISSISIISLIYISPITITCVLFKKTKNIFDKWWKYLLSFALQPVILFAYLGVLIFAFDTFVAGEGIKWDNANEHNKGIFYIGSPDDTGNINPYKPKNFSCSGVNNSLYCIKNIQWDTYHVEYLDLRMPYIKDLSMAIDIEYLIKALFIMLIFTQFLSKITTLAASLTDGKSIQGKNIGVLDTSVKTYGAVYGVGTRAARAGQKLYNYGKSIIRSNDAAKKDAPINAKAPQAEVTSNIGSGSNNSNVAPTSAPPASAARTASPEDKKGS